MKHKKSGERLAAGDEWEKRNPQSPVLSPQSSTSHPLKLVSLSMETPGLSPEVLLRQARGEARFFWQDARMENGRSPLTFAGFGVAAQLYAWGENRFASIQAQADALFDDMLLLSSEQQLATPRLFGGFAFRDDFTPDNTWSIYPRAYFILPHYQIVKVGHATWLTINTLLPEEDLQDSLPALREALQTRYAELNAKVQRDEEVKEEEERKEPVAVNYPLSAEAWATQIEAAKARMRETDLNKVVLSRVCEIKFADRVPVDNALDYLQMHYADCTRFLFEPRPFHAFYGATPEMLAAVNGRNLATTALAGSIARGTNKHEDRLYAQELLHSAKDLHEHALVVASLRRRLASIVTALSIPESPTIYKLHNIQHLYTPISARLKQAGGVLPVVEALHPTPALGGSPRDLAMAFISEAEPVPRGWYAAPIGWMDSEGNGRFSVAIRSAVAQDRRVWLYAGAGIVPASDPQKEWEETALKFRPMLEALQIDKTWF
ncbi:MAG: isochorismate synthase [Anaerolineales bacterium]|nr:isochorismate synthase [Anaerolineales bacterium]